MYRSQETVKNNTKSAATADESDDFYWNKNAACTVKTEELYSPNHILR